MTLQTLTRFFHKLYARDFSKDIAGDISEGLCMISHLKAQTKCLSACICEVSGTVATN